MSHKTRDTYASILARHGVEPNRFLMIGNSLRSDVLPVVEIGGRAVYVPAAMTWTHDHAEIPAHAHGRYFEVASLERLEDVIEMIERAPR